MKQLEKAKLIYINVKFDEQIMPSYLGQYEFRNAGTSHPHFQNQSS